MCVWFEGGVVAVVAQNKMDRGSAGPLTRPIADLPSPQLRQHLGGHVLHGPCRPHHQRPDRQMPEALAPVSVFKSVYREARRPRQAPFAS